MAFIWLVPVHQCTRKCTLYCFFSTSHCPADRPFRGVQRPSSSSSQTIIIPPIHQFMCMHRIKSLTLDQGTQHKRKHRASCSFCCDWLTCWMILKGSWVLHTGRQWQWEARDQTELTLLLTSYWKFSCCQKVITFHLFLGFWKQKVAMAVVFSSVQWEQFPHPDTEVWGTQ